MISRLWPLMLKQLFFIVISGQSFTASRSLAFLYLTLARYFVSLLLSMAFDSRLTSSTCYFYAVLTLWVCIAVRLIMLFSLVLGRLHLLPPPFPALRRSSFRHRSGPCG